MAMYFQGSASEIQPHDVQTLYLMNPAASYQANNMVFLNNPLSSTIPQQHFVGIPLQPSQDSHSSPYDDDDDRDDDNNNNISSNNNIWTVPSNASNANSVEVRPNNIVPVAQQGLSLSLSSSSNGGMQSVLMGSKYLMAAQQLLDEVVNVGMKGSNDVTKRERTRSSDKDLDQGGDGDGSGKKMGSDLSTAERQEIQMKKAKLVNMLDEVEQRYRQYHHQMQIVVSSFEAVAGFGSARSYTALALQTISKQFRCLRDAISAQIRAAGKSLGEEDCLDNGGGKSMGSRLRFVDYHLRQQRALQQLGMIQNNAWRPQRGLPERAVSVLRAWLFEHFLHPYPKDSDKHMLAKQTGLTRSQVSNWFINARVRLWKPMVEEMYLEETKEQEQNNGGDDKRSKSEASESTSQQANSSTPPVAGQHESFKSMQNNTLNAPKPQPNIAVHPSTLGRSDESIMQQRVKKIRSEHSIHQNTIIPNQMTVDIKPDELSNRELLMKFMDQGTGFGAYPMGEIGQFDHEQFAPRFGGNGVSLSLGLPHCETLSLSGSQQPSFLSNESIPLENNYFSLNNNNSNNPSSSHPPNGYESINIQNRKRFAAQLLPDFVA